MKKLLLVAILILSSLLLFGQDTIRERYLPSTMVKTLDGKTVDICDLVFANDSMPVIVSFWATWCKPCVSELTTISEMYDDWRSESGVKLIAVSIDDARTSGGVKPFVNGKAWDYEVVLDINGDLKRAMNVNMVPHTFILDGKGRIVWEHTSFAPGTEDEMLKIVWKIVTKQM